MSSKFLRGVLLNVSTNIYGYTASLTKKKSMEHLVIDENRSAVTSCPRANILSSSHDRFMGPTFQGWGWGGKGIADVHSYISHHTMSVRNHA